MPDDDILSASEIGQWTYCSRAWHLARAGADNRNAQALARGQRAHDRHGKDVGRAQTLRRLAMILILLALALLAAALILNGGAF